MAASINRNPLCGEGDQMKGTLGCSQHWQFPQCFAEDRMTQTLVALTPCSCSGCGLSLHLALEQTWWGLGFFFRLTSLCHLNWMSVLLRSALWQDMPLLGDEPELSTRWTWWVSEKGEIPGLGEVYGAAELCCLLVSYAQKSSARCYITLLWCQGPSPIMHCDVHCIPSLNPCLEDPVFHKGLYEVPKVRSLKAIVQLIPYSCRN